MRNPKVRRSPSPGKLLDGREELQKNERNGKGKAREVQSVMNGNGGPPLLVNGVKLVQAQAQSAW